jgi:hypothetical protein
VRENGGLTGNSKKKELEKSFTTLARFDIILTWT